MLHIRETLPYARPIFPDRPEAGQELARFVDGAGAADPIVLGIPRGGLPVGFPLACELIAPLDVLVLRKLPIPDSPEAGFGAITPDGTIILNEPLVRQAGLTEATIRRVAESVLREVQRRQEAYRGSRPFPSLKCRDVFLLDDGLATGYTMLAAIQMVRKAGARRIIVAVPASPLDSARRVEQSTDELYVLVAQQHGPFAVASFYERFPDLSNQEVREWISRPTN